MTVRPAPAAHRPVFAVIIPTCDRPAQLQDCLTSLVQQSFPRSAFEVIVVDDGSAQSLTDTVGVFSDRLDVRVIRQARQGPAVARNTGLAASRARYAAFTDDDCRPAPQWLERLAQALAERTEVLVGGRVVNALAGNVFAATSQLIHDIAYEHYNALSGGAQFFATNNLAGNVEALVRLGGFDAGFRVASEDRDLCARWHESGRTLVYAPDAEVWHAHRLSLRQFCAQHFRYGRGAWRFHAALRRRGQGRFVRDLSFHTRFLRRAAKPITQRRGYSAIAVGALLAVWQVANLAGFVFEGVTHRLPDAGPAAKIS